ncbi:hypothetical protein Oter_1851 [Opitutus terrae PB90-1]|uniref:Uncharacterized protein n=1 Tax=Opitutus terrae (strain DSM 11246 / JCM 15787 / PB90-1) TaxID=452637 RepID=B1ZX23_OPITP|nr:hypothetical protein Oter_1851 [Opitutus terrae PB90-1]
MAAAADTAPEGWRLPFISKRCATLLGPSSQKEATPG